MDLLPGFFFGLDLGFQDYWFVLFMELDGSINFGFIGYSDQQYKDCLSFFVYITFSTIDLSYSMFAQLYPLIESDIFLLSGEWSLCK